MLFLVLKGEPIPMTKVILRDRSVLPSVTAKTTKGL